MKVMNINIVLLLIFILSSKAEVLNGSKTLPNTIKTKSIPTNSSTNKCTKIFTSKVIVECSPGYKVDTVLDVNNCIASKKCVSDSNYTQGIIRKSSTKIIPSISSKIISEIKSKSTKSITTTTLSFKIRPIPTFEVPVSDLPVTTANSSTKSIYSTKVIPSLTKSSKSIPIIVATKTTSTTTISTTLSFKTRPIPTFEIPVSDLPVTTANSSTKSIYSTKVIPSLTKSSKSIPKIISTKATTTTTNVPVTTATKNNCTKIFTAKILIDCQPGYEVQIIREGDSCTAIPKCIPKYTLTAKTTSTKTIPKRISTTSTKTIPKRISTTSTKTIPKRISTTSTKTIPKRISTTSTKTIPKRISTTSTKTISKRISTTSTKTIPKRISTSSIKTSSTKVIIYRTTTTTAKNSQPTINYLSCGKDDWNCKNEMSRKCYAEADNCWRQSWSEELGKKCLKLSENCSKIWVY